MITQSEVNFPNDAVAFAIEASAPLEEWTIDELNQYSDLDSVHSAWTHSDTAMGWEGSRFARQ